MAQVYMSEASHLPNFHRVSTQRVFIGLNMLLMLLVIVMFTVWLPGVAASVATQFDSPQATQILKNRSFETKGSTAKLAANWILFQGDNDQRECNKVDRPGKPDLIVANTGKCAFRFIGGAGRTTLLTQNVKPIVGEAGDTLYLSGFIQATNLVLTDGTAQLRLMVDYQGGGNETSIAHISAGTYEYTQINAPPLLLAKKVKKVRVQVRMVGGSGRFYADTLSLIHVPSAEATPVPTWTSSLTPTLENTATAQPTNTPTATDTEFPSNTPSATPKTPTATNTALPTFTPTPSRTRSATPTPTLTFTPTATNTATTVPLYTNTPVPTATSTSTPVMIENYCGKIRFQIYDDYSVANSVHFGIVTTGLYSAQVDGLNLIWNDDIPGHTPAVTTMRMEMFGETVWTGNDNSSPTNTTTEGTFNFASPYRIINPNTYMASQVFSVSFSDIPEPLTDYINIADLMGSSLLVSHPSGRSETCNIPLEYIQFPTPTPALHPCDMPYVLFNGMNSNGEVSYQMYNFSSRTISLIGFHAAWPDGAGAYWLRRLLIRHTSGGTPTTVTVYESYSDGQDVTPNTSHRDFKFKDLQQTIAPGQNKEIILDFDPISGTLSGFGAKAWEFDGTYFVVDCGN